jgi:hypothetical protein
MIIEEQPLLPTNNREAMAYFTPAAFCWVSGCTTIILSALRAYLPVITKVVLKSDLRIWEIKNDKAAQHLHFAYGTIIFARSS